MSRADVVVIGAGVMGASVAWHLTTLGVRDVVLVDAGAAPGAGSTGRMPGLANLYAINGSSGHGVMHAPVLGELLAEIIVHGEARSLDVGALRPGRFADGQPNPAPVLL